MNFIDAHSHIWTPDTKTYPLAAGFNRGRMNPLSFTAEELMKRAKPVGVNRVVLIQISFYGYNNQFMLESIRKSPKQFVGVALIDQDARRPELEMQKLKKLGVTGFRIYPKNQKQGDWLGSESMHRMWTTAAKENLNMCCLINPADLTSLDRMCRDFPDTPVVIDHLCRVGAGSPIVEKDVKALCDIARHKNVSVKVSAFYALGKKKAPYRDLSPLIKRIYNAFGPKRLMWASDSPFQVVGGHTYKASIDLVKQGLPFLKKDDKTWLLGKTAERVFFRTNS